MFNSPLSSEKVDRVIALLDLAPSSRIVDLGCGEGEFLLRAMERYGAVGYGVDPQANLLEICRSRSRGRVAPETLHLFDTTGADFDWPDEPFDLAICIGSSHAFKGYISTLQKLKNHVRPNGMILMGDIFWNGKPMETYERFLGDGWPSFDTDFTSYLTVGENEGLLSLYSIRSSEDEWDHFEGVFAMSRIRKALAKSDPRERDQDIKKAKDWRDAYLQWGRSTMGFGLYLYKNTEDQQGAAANP